MTIAGVCLNVALLIGFCCTAANGQVIPATQQPEPGIRLLLRPTDDVGAVTLGVPIHLQYACVIDEGVEIASLCRPLIEMKPISEGARLSLDEPNLELLGEACSAFGGMFCGALETWPKLKFSPTPEWKDVTVETHFPVSAGVFEVRARIEADQQSTGEREVRSDALQLEILDDPGWHHKLLRYRGCRVHSALAVLPDEPRAESVLRSHLADCAKESNEMLSDAMEEIVSLRLQTKAPQIYQLMHELHSEVHAATSEIRLEPDKVQKVTRWMRKTDRELFLETANQLITEYRRDPYNEDLNSDLDDAFTNWGRLIRDSCDSRHPSLDRQEVEILLRAGGPDGATIKDILD